jgi:anaerobic magnesium-protoporphyrin IX monomethyl ester cyclase
MWGRNVRYRSVGNVIEELQLLKNDYGVKQIRFHDDTMTINKPWIMEFCREMGKLGLRWRAATRVDRSSADMLQAMFDAGCYEMAYGIEDPDQTVLDINNKGVKTKDIYKALATAKRIGFKTRLYLMIGLPGQDENTSRRLIDFIDRVEPTVADLSTFVPFPGSDVFNNPHKYGIILNNTPWDDYVFTRGLYGDETDKDFIYQHDKLSNGSLKRQRKEVLDYIKTRRLALAE